jgi:hypothetical protein
VTEIEGEFKPELGPLPASAPQVIATRGIPTSPLRVVSFNVQRLEDVDAVADVFLHHPDLSRAGLILLQEVERHPLEGASRIARLADRLGLGYVYIPARIKGDGTHGLAILSPFPILDVQEMELPHADLTISEARRIAVSANVLVDGKLLPVVNVHLDTVLNVRARARPRAGRRPRPSRAPGSRPARRRARPGRRPRAPGTSRQRRLSGARHEVIASSVPGGGWDAARPPRTACAAAGRPCVQVAASLGVLR